MTTPQRGDRDHYEPEDDLAVNARALGIEYFIKALSTGEVSAANRLEPHLADDVEYETESQSGSAPGRDQFTGKEQVLGRVTGQWPNTPFYSRIGWSDPVPDGGVIKVTSSSAIVLSVEFNGSDQIQRILLEGGRGSGAQPPPAVGGKVDEIPLQLKPLINNARSDQRPFAVTYVDDKGVPHSSYRGSVCVIGPTQLGMWARDAGGGLPTAIAKNPYVTLMYQDFSAGAPLINLVSITGRAHVATDEETRRRVYELGIEAEQNHDVARKGAAVVVEIVDLRAFAGGVQYFMHRD